ncbi:PQQ-binding-like beta-propeller repeat protein [bacterium]|nr:PQQ-binding-like beta-propeller repeat protein [bacterium]
MSRLVCCVFTVLVSLVLLAGCSRQAGKSRVPKAMELASGDYPGGHYQLQVGNRLRVMMNFNDALIEDDASLGGWNYYGSRPMMLPDQEVLADRELLLGPDGWLATTRRDGYLEVWRNDDPDTGFARSGEIWTPEPFWPGSQYPAADTCVLLDDVLLTTILEQSVTCFSYEGQEQWNFLMGAPARLLLDDGKAFAASDDGFLYCLDMDGGLRWKKYSASHHAGLLDAGRIAYTAIDGGVECADPSGEVLWNALPGAEIRELRSSGGNLWLRIGDGLQGLDADGQSLALRWPDDLVVRDIVAGLNGETFVSGFPAEYPDPTAGSPNATSMVATPVTGLLFCYDSAGNRLWLYQGLQTGMRIIPAHDRQCWLVDLSVQTNLPVTLWRVGLPITSQGA